MQEKTVKEAIHYRRSVRKYDKNTPIEASVVKNCIEQATLAPNSSNMQLWEFYHVTSKEIINKIAPLCFNQNAAKTAQQLVIFVTRKDLWRKRTKANINHINNTYKNKQRSTKDIKREKFARSYYKKVIPFAYTDIFGILGWLKLLLTFMIGIFKPIYRQVKNSDMRIVAHKSTGLAAQNFMLSMASVGYDTCPMEGYDSWRLKKILQLPISAEINMIISCGIREEDGIYSERFRVPFKEVYKEI